MQHEKIFIREDKSRVKIIINLAVREYGLDAGATWSVRVMKCAPNKRTWFDVVNTNDYEYRMQSFPEGRNCWEKNKQLEYVTPEEVLEVKMELWNKLKPTL